MNEERANLRGIPQGVQRQILASGPLVAPVECLALAPAAASDDHRARSRVLFSNTSDTFSRGFRHDVCPVGDELAIHAKNSFERALDLGGGVILRLQATHRRIDQLTENG